MPAFPRQRTPADNSGYSRQDSYGDSSFQSDSFQSTFRDLYRDDEGRRDPRTQIYGDAPQAGSYRDQTPPHELPPAPDVFKRGFNRKSGFKSLPGWARFLTALGVLLVALVVTHLFFFQAFSVQSSAMGPTLQAGDRVLVNKVVYDFRAPKRGEIVLFHGAAPKWTPEGSSDSESGIFASIGATIGSWVGVSTPDKDEFFRRVIAVPGDTIACCDSNGHVTINGKPLNETYVHNDSPLDASAPGCGSRYFNPVVVSPGNVFVMGDNRVASLDSRCISQVPTNTIVGRATAMVWNSWGSLSVPSTFNNIPKSYAGPTESKNDGGTGLVIGLPVLAAFGLRTTKLRRTRAEQ